MKYLYNSILLVDAVSSSILYNRIVEIQIMFDEITVRTVISNKKQRIAK